MPAGLPKHHLFVRDDILPSWFANAIQEMIGTRPIRLRHDSTTAVKIDAAADDPVGLVIAGRWRMNAAKVTRAVAGAAGRYSVWAVADENDISNVPDPFTDETDYSFELRIVAGADGVPAVEPGVWAISRKIGELLWDGGKITRVFPSVGEKPRHLPGVMEFMAGGVDAGVRAVDGVEAIPGEGQLVNVADFPGLFGAVGHSANGNVDPGGGQFRVPDGRGRFLVGVGTHADVVGAGRTENGFVAKATDEANLATRRPRHTHTVADHTHTLPNHTHNVPGHYHGRGTLAVTAVGSHRHGAPDGNPYLVTFTNVGIAPDGGAQPGWFQNAHKWETGDGGGHGHSLSGSIGNTSGSAGDSAFATGNPNSLPASGGATPATDAQQGAYLTGHWIVYV